MQYGISVWIAINKNKNKKEKMMKGNLISTFFLILLVKKCEKMKKNLILLKNFFTIIFIKKCKEKKERN